MENRKSHTPVALRKQIGGTMYVVRVHFIYAGDLNGDGVKEIYVIDSSSTAAKYAIGEKGMYIDNEDITYGQSLHIADFNGDGLSDCLVSYGQDADSMEMRLSVEKS